MLTPEQKALLQRHVSIDGDGNVVGNDNTVRVTRHTAGDYAVQIGEQHITVTVEELRRVLHIEHSQVGIIGDYAHIEGGIHQHKHYHYDAARISLPPPHVHHIPLPPHYIKRQEVLDAAREALLETNDSVALTSAIQNTSGKAAALHGMGGIGKTVVARALCEDPEVQAAFPDGILWTTLGREATDAELRSKLREWIDALGGVVSEIAPTLDQLKATLAQLLAERACLLIVDDVWRRTHAEAFLVGGPRCRLLLTTRYAEIAHGLGARLHPVDVMAREQAVVLLEQWADGKLDGVTDDVKGQIVTRVGCLPLAVKLAGEQLRRHDPARWLARFDAGKLRRRRPEDVHDSLFQTFSLSLDDLGEEDCHCYTALAIFPEDEPIPLFALTKLWGALVGLDEDAARDLMHDLAARALVQLDETVLGLAVTLHDLLRDFITDAMGEQGARGANRALLDAYRATKEGAGWHTAPDDGYLYTHLTYHLDTLADHDEGAAAELCALFATDTWLHARVPADDYCYDGYLADLARAWRRAQDQALAQVAARQPPPCMAESVHYALIQTTVNALATNYPPELVARALEVGLWSPARGLSMFRRVIDLKKRAQMATALLATGQLLPAQRVTMGHLGLTAALELPEEHEYHWDRNPRAEALAALVPHLEGDLLAEGLAAARAIESERRRVEVLAALAPHLGDEARKLALAEAVAAARSIEDEGWRAKALAALAPHLEGDLSAEGLAAARAIEDEGSRADALVALAPHLEGKARKQALAEGLAAARAIEVEWLRADALAALAPHLEDEARKQALAEELAAARATESERRRVEVLARAKALAALAPHLEGDLLAEGLAAARAIEVEERRADVLVALAPHLEGELLAEGLAAARAIEVEWLRAKALAGLVPNLEGKARKQALAEGLAAARAIEDVRWRVYALAALAPHLEGEAREQALAEGVAAARAIWGKTWGAKALAELAPHLEGEARKQALAERVAAAQAIEDEWSRAEALVALAPHLEGDLLAEAVAAAQAIEDEKRRADALVALAPHLEGEARKQALAEGLPATRAIEGLGFQAFFLAMFSSHLESDVLAERAAAAQAIEDEWSQAEALPAPAPHLEGDLLVERVAAAQAIEDEWSQAEALTALAPHLEGSLLAEAVVAARAIEDEKGRADALAALAPHLEGEARKQALAEGLAAARAIEDERWRAKALAGLAPHLEGNLLAEGLAAARAIEDERWRTDALARLAPHLEGELLAEGLAAVRAIRNEEYRAVTLSTLALGILQLHTTDTTLLQEARQALVQCLWDYQARERKDLLWLLARDNAAFLCAFDLPQEAYSRIAQSIIDICTKWEWL